MSYCVVILRTSPYWSVRVASCNFKLGGYCNSFHCRSRTASDMTCKLGITFVDESKDFYVKKSGQSSCRRAKRSWLVEVRRRKRLRLDENCLLRSLVHQYINNQQPVVLKRQLSLPATSTHTREL